MTNISVSSSDQTSNPQIYVACLAAYNNAKLHGEWINATQDVEDISKEIQAMLQASPEPDAEEYAIHDYDEFYNCRLGEWPDLETIHAMANLIVEHGEVAAELYNHLGGYINEVEYALENCDEGEWESEKDFAENFFDEIYSREIPENLHFYFDVDLFARDLFLGGDYYSLDVGGKVHIFNAHG